MRRFKMARGLLLVGSVLVVVLFGDGLLTFAQQKTEPELMWEMRFEEGKPQVVRNEVTRLKRERKVDKFPLKTMANQKEKKIVWFDEDGKVRKERTFEDAKRLLVSQDGRFFGVARREFHEGSFELEYFDEQGRSLWKEWIGDVIYMSPTGETVVGGDAMEGEHMTFIDSQGTVRRYEDFTRSFRPVFSADGRYVFCSMYQKEKGNPYQKGNRSVVLFDNEGNMLWKRYEASYEHLFIHDVAISGDGKYVAVARLDKESGITHVSALDVHGNILWERASGHVYELEFSEDGGRIAVLNGGEKNLVILRTVDGKGVAAYHAAGPQSIRHAHLYLYLLDSERCLFGTHGKTKDESWIVDLRLYDKKGERLWNVSFQVDAPEVEWIPYGKTLAINAGSSFKVFGLWDIDQS